MGNERPDPRDIGTGNRVRNFMYGRSAKPTERPRRVRLNILQI